MGKLAYSMIISLDGYFEDDAGNFDWAEPEQALHEYFNVMESRAEILIYGRRMYEIMSVWENFGNREGLPAYIQDYSKIWKSKQKIVFSRTLEKVGTRNTALERDLTESVLRGIKARTSGSISIGGAEIASAALELNLVDEIYAFIMPVLVGNGKKWIEHAHLKKLDLVETRRFDGGAVMVHYAVDNATIKAGQGSQGLK